MFIDWLSKEDLKDSDSLIIRVAAVVLFAGSVFILDEILIWNLSLLSLTGISVIAGGIGFFVAKTSPIAIKAIPPVVFFFVTALLSKELYESYSLQKERSVFLAETDNCKALGLQIVNKGSWTPVCMERDTLANNIACSYFRDNDEWFCKTYSHSDVIAMPGRSGLPLKH
ncbi:MAG: hypothetical protein CML20_08000 [Rheinheimera sp.]|uniref:hypothetical protein n=1 Tax=Arsukibacterium sp. UBA3155 TaxID=1946058 RepID=UPI000C8C2A71|nr:hypothetical protein [Arsukibacterium sp. UBA3155]MAD74717.1 hypothetical protein [Rheinheimera sp.]|tara:strand:+ start:161092 stop:161601 length:510 start_codon:yes stop_codon:yes gene_type:complete